MSSIHALILAAAGVMASSIFAHADERRDVVVPAPVVNEPERGSVAGSLSHLTIGPGDLDRGTFAMPAPLVVPSARGSILWNVFPTYTPEAGQSEWGMGWNAERSIRRHRVIGHIDYRTDEYLSPWGRLTQGSNGYWYVRGQPGTMRLSLVDDGWEAISPEGTHYRFDVHVDTASGIYAWYLSAVETAQGDKTVLEYERNDSGRPFLIAVTYGARGHTDAYRVTFAYEPIDVPLVHYGAGEPLVLDRRVSRVDVWTRHARTGTHEIRWSHELGYRDSAVGPSFYLASVTRQYASGAIEPPVTYAYELPTERVDDRVIFHAEPLSPAPGVDAYLAAVNNPSGIQPNQVTMVDENEDGLLDIEYPALPEPGTMFHQQPDGTFVAEALPPMPPDVHRPCRGRPSLSRGPRTLIRLRPDDDELHVVVLRAYWSATRMYLCDRVGRLIYQQAIDHSWPLGPHNRVVDLNGDHRPDIVHAGGGSYQVLENISGQGCGAGDEGPCVPIGFVLHPPHELRYRHGWAYTPDVTWMHDMNGDGYLDLVTRYRGDVSVWYGRGNLKFIEDEVSIPFINRRNQVMGHVAQFGFTWVDANRDGLMDALLTRGSAIYMFINQGDHFQEVLVPVLEEAMNRRWNVGAPVVADLRASGNTEVVYVISGDAHALPLNNPATGLMVRADDGKGTAISFEYARAPATEGVPHRASVMAAMTVNSSGYDSVRHTYDYAAPVVHSRGKMLVGFGEVRQADAVVNRAVTFHHDDNISGVVLETLITDARTPDLVRFARTDHNERSYEGVRWLRPRRDVIGYRSLDGPATEITQTTEYETYEREWCPTRVRGENAHGTLIRETILAEPPSLPTDLHCLPAHERERGLHADAARDFLLEQEITRNALGQVTAVIQHGDAGATTLQTVTYDHLHRVESLAQPGRGETRVAYDSSTGLMREVRTPDGVIHRVQEHDPVTDAMRALAQDRGPGGVLTSSFRFDALERLERSWRDFGGSSESTPSSVVTYAFPTHTHPGRIRARNLLDGGAGVYSEDVALVAADGADIATAVRIPEGWDLSGLVYENRSEREVSTYRRSPIDQAIGLDSVTHDLLRVDAVRLGLRRSAGFGHVIDARESVQTGVERIVEETLVLDGQALITTATENGTFVTRTAADLGSNVLWHQDPGGAVTAYERDALGRLVQVTLPDGQQHRVAYDAYGRPARIERTNIGTIAHDYDPHTGLLTATRVHGASGALARSVTFARDAIGRVTAENHTLAATGETRQFAYAYDGALEPPLPGQRGHLTRTTGPRHQRTIRYNPDGTEAERTLRIDDWRAVTWRTDYYANGDPRQVRRTVRDLARNAVVDELIQGFHYDAWGRLARLTVNGQDLATIAYDAEGRLDHATLTGGAVIAYQYDDTTHALRSSWQDSGLWVAGVEWELDARGHIARETFAFGDDFTERAYAFDARGFLESARDPARAATYEYGAAGLPTAISDERGTRVLARTDDTLRAGDLEYVYDDQGRVIRKGDLALSYGPDGHLAEARRGEVAWRYYHDEHGQRLFKEQNGRIVAAYVDGGYLTDAGFLTPVRLAGRLVGVLDGATFHLLATDPRGTVLADRDGTPRLATPYGVRTIRPDLSAALDYVEKGFDAALGTVRMGVRDYDPFIGQFHTPDSLFLTEPGRCVASPVECNLYSYAANDPLRYLDPNGQDALDWVQGLLDGTSVALDATGIGASVSWIPDLLNAGISAGRGDWTGAGLSLTATVPVLGATANGTRLLRAIQKGTDKAGDTVRTADKATDAIRGAAKGASTPRNAHLAGKTHPKTGVPFDASGYPDFRAAGVVKKEVKISPTASRAGDFKAANEAAGLKKTPEGYTWHHHQDGTTMQLVPRDVHAQTGHTGGFSRTRRY